MLTFHRNNMGIHILDNKSYIILSEEKQDRTTTAI